MAYRRSREEMPAHPWEVAEALEEGVVLHTGLGPARIETAGGKVSGIAFHPRIAGSGETRQTQPRFDESKTTVLAADTIIVAVGQGIDSAGLGVATGSNGRIAADKDTLATNVAGIFAGGDAVLGPASIVDAMAQGHRAAEAIDAYLRGGQAGARRRRLPPRPKPARNPEPGAPRADRVKMPRADMAARLARLRRDRPGLYAGAGHRRSPALPGVRPVQRVHGVREGLFGRRHPPRATGRGTPSSTWAA